MTMFYIFGYPVSTADFFTAIMILTWIGFIALMIVIKPGRRKK